MSNMLNRRTFAITAASLAVANITRAVAAQEVWPSRPIRMVIPASAGGGSDLLARALTDRLAVSLKQPFVIDNKPGASGAIGTLAVTRAAADGYTLLYSNAGATVMAEALIPKLPFSTLRDLVPVALCAVGGVLLLVNSEVPARNLPELVELVRKNPERYAYGSPAVGSNGHLTMEWLKQRTGIKTIHVPYKTTPNLLADLVSGVVPIAWLDLSSPLPFIEQGRLRPIAINGGKRNPRLPDLPTMTEQGHSFPAVGFQGIFAPIGTPTEVVQRLNRDVNGALGTPEYQATMRRLNVDPPEPLNPQDFRQLVATNFEVWKQIAREAKIELES